MANLVLNNIYYEYNQQSLWQIHAENSVFEKQMKDNGTNSAYCKN